MKIIILLSTIFLIATNSSAQKNKIFRNMSFTNKEGKWFNTEGFQVNDKTVKLNSKTKANNSPSLNG